MTSQAQSQSDKTTFNMDWSFGVVQLERVLLERIMDIMEQIRGGMDKSKLCCKRKFTTGVKNRKPHLNNTEYPLDLISQARMT
jgi:hypothetical protein